MKLRLSAVPLSASVLSLLQAGMKLWVFKGQNVTVLMQSSLLDLALSICPLTVKHRKHLPLRVCGPKGMVTGSPSTLPTTLPLTRSCHHVPAFFAIQNCSDLIASLVELCVWLV